MKLLSVVAALLLPLVASSQTAPPAAAPDGKNCPAVTPGQRVQHLMKGHRKAARAAANVGVDALGRVLLAVDLDRDGLAEELVLFTPRQRLEGPWSRLVPAVEYEATRGTLRVEAADRSLAIALSVAPAPLPRFKHKPAAGALVVEQPEGNELATSRPGDNMRQPIESYDHALIESWPESFRHDLVMPGTHTPSTCINCIGKCQRGGCYAPDCGHTCNGIITDDRCSIGCNAFAFACCNCTNGIFFPIASCRCIPCRSYS
jgi:hypothetical protein